MNHTNHQDHSHTTSTTSSSTSSNSKVLFHMTFGGYSVTAGHGNLHSLSYPYIVQQQLQTIFTTLHHNIELLVTNAAM